jgi:hypothetical protein
MEIKNRKFDLLKTMKQKSFLILFLFGLFIAAGCSKQSNFSILESSGENSSLLVEEYELVSADVDTPTHLEFMQRLTPTITEKRMRWKNLIPNQVVQDANAILSKYGYSIKHDAMLSSYTYHLMQGYTILLDGIYPVGSATENASQDNFAFLVQSNDGISYLLQKDGVKEWQPGSSVSFAPIYFGDELIYPVISSTIQILSENGTVIYKTSLPSNPVMNPIETFEKWNGHWILEKDGEVIMDGKSLNSELGLNEIFHWQVIQGKPFFFFRESKDGPYFIQFAGQRLEQEYDEIAHYQCCEAGAFNPQGNVFMTWFFASRDGKWNYVEAGLYPNLTE